MIESIIEILPEIAYMLIAGGLTVVGLTIEFTGVQNILTGHHILGVWMLFIGLVALYAGVHVTRDKALPAIRGV